MRMPSIGRLISVRRYPSRAGTDERIALRYQSHLPMVTDLGFAECVTFAIIDRQSGDKAGEIALRAGDSRPLFYLGHIGYHVDPAYRGHHYALRACRLCLPLLKEMGMGSLVITTDEDNAASIRTCEGLGCRLESTVNVPRWCCEKFQISQRKRRYVLVLA